MSSEADTRANFIDPALVSPGWMSQQIIREYYFTDGRKLAGHQRGSRCFVDYLLHTENQHLAIIEAKKNSAILPYSRHRDLTLHSRGSYIGVFIQERCF